MDAEMWSLIVKLISPILSPLVEWIKVAIARIWYRKLKLIILNGEYRDDKFVFQLKAELKVLAMGFFDGRIRCLEGEIKNTLEELPKDDPHKKGEAATEEVKGVFEGVDIHLITIRIVEGKDLIVPSSYSIILSLNRKTFIGTNLALAAGAGKGAVGWLRGRATIQYG